jgi:mRNA-degrading endonuclease RelE of RelBE toxin-antitoxin system
MYDVLVKKRTIQDIEKLPAATQKKLAMLIDDLKD